MIEQLANVDALSPAAIELLASRKDGCRRLVIGSLDGESASVGTKSGLSSANLFSRPARSPNDAACVLSAIWLWCDCLDESHRISQGIATPGGSYLHAIAHRREGDFWNSKYWLNRVGVHQAMTDIAARCRPIVEASPAGKALRPMVEGSFDASAFVDIVEMSANQSGDLGELLVAIQRVELMVLTDRLIAAAIA